MSIPLSSTRLCLANLRACVTRPPQHAPYSLLRLPPETRTSIYRSQISKFHASHRCSEAAVTTSGVDTTQLATDATVSAASGLEHTIYALLDTLHSSSGLSWAYTIPLSAIIVRSLLFPWALADREGQQRYFDLQPLLNAWKIKLLDQVYYRYADEHDSDWMRRVHSEAVANKTRELIARWDASGWSRGSLIIAQLPIFLGMSSVYRRMCGAPNGFVSALLAALPIVGSRGAGTSTAGGDGVSSPVFQMIDPTLAFEGMLWFPNLMLPDTTLYLGAITAGLNLVMLALSTTRSRRTGGTHVPLSLWRRMLITTATLVSLAIIPISASMPSGVMLYWASSTAATLTSNVLLDTIRPLKTSPAPCKKRARVTFEFKRNA